MGVISISRIDLMKLYNGTLQKIIEKYVTNTKDLNFTNDQTTINLSKSQLEFIDSKVINRSELLSMILISYIKKLETKNINHKIAFYLSEFYRMAINDWMLYDFNLENDYDASIQEFIDLVNNRKQMDKKIYNRKYKVYSAGEVPKTLINLFHGNIYANRILGHLLDNEFLTYGELVKLTGCNPSSYISTIIRDVINIKYPKLILKQHNNNDNRTWKFSINKKVWNLIQKEVCLKNVARS
jgi:hypothetical protein